MGSEHVSEYFSHDQLAREFGMEIVEFSSGCATVRMPVQEKHFNSARMSRLPWPRTATGPSP
jgi:acyl-coenzyme A thioesterase PaaI-like protein